MKSTASSRWISAAFLCAVLGAFLVLVIRYQRRPTILELNKLKATPGDQIEIRGKAFGRGMDSSKLLIGSFSLSLASILEWEDNRILAKVPHNDGTVFVKVETRFGLSNGVIFGDEDLFPEIEYGPWLPGAAYIKYAEPQNLRIGELITLHGEGFENKRGSGRIWVNSRDKLLRLGAEEPDLSLYIEARNIGKWTENVVQFWIPEGASSGNIYLQKGAKFSNPFSVELIEDAGEILQGEAFHWSLRQKIAIAEVSSTPQNALYLHIPSPLPGIGQGEAVVLDAYSEKPYSPISVRGNLNLYRVDNLGNGESVNINRQIFLKTHSVEVNIHRETPYHPSHPEIVAALAQDEWVKPNLVASLGSSLVANRQGNWFKSKDIYNYVISKFSFDENSKGQSVAEYISSDFADSLGYSLLFTSIARAAGVPARPVGGILVLDNLSTRPWWWSEIWINGIGWVPVDSALGDSSIKLVELEENPADYYFGALEGRHIAFSRGILNSSALQPNPRLRRKEEIFTLQGVYEELSGNLESYRSNWPVPEVTKVRR